MVKLYFCCVVLMILTLEGRAEEAPTVAKVSYGIALMPKEIIPELYEKYREAVKDDKRDVSYRRLFTNDREYEIHVQKLKEVNGFKLHNLRIGEKNKLGSTLIYINNPVESKLPNSYLTLEEFKQSLIVRAAKGRQLGSKKAKYTIFQYVTIHEQHTVPIHKVTETKAITHLKDVIKQAKEYKTAPSKWKNKTHPTKNFNKNKLENKKTNKNIFRGSNNATVNNVVLVSKNNIILKHKNKIEGGNLSKEISTVIGNTTEDTRRINKTNRITQGNNLKQLSIDIAIDKQYSTANREQSTVSNHRDEITRSFVNKTKSKQLRNSYFKNGKQVQAINDGKELTKQKTYDPVVPTLVPNGTKKKSYVSEETSIVSNRFDDISTKSDGPDESSIQSDIPDEVTFVSDIPQETLGESGKTTAAFVDTNLEIVASVDTTDTYDVTTVASYNKKGISDKKTAASHDSTVTSDDTKIVSEDTTVTSDNTTSATDDATVLSDDTNDAPDDVDRDSSTVATEEQPSEEITKEKATEKVTTEVTTVKPTRRTLDRPAVFMGGSWD